MADYAIIIVLVASVAAAAFVAWQRSRKGSACCGEHDEAPKRTRVADRNKAHYPYTTELAIGGMTCANCAIRVENALNALPGTWATVSLDAKRATVRTKDEPDATAFRDAVASAGYVVLG